MTDRPTKRFWHAYDRLHGGDGTLIKDLKVGPARAKRTNAKPEQEVLNAVLSMLRVHPKVAWCARINSGAYKTPDGRFIRFGFVGCGDILGQMRDGRLLMMEVKAEHGRVTEDQEAMIAKVVGNRGLGGVVRSVDEALAIVEGR